MGKLYKCHTNYKTWANFEDIRRNRTWNIYFYYEKRSMTCWKGEQAANSEGTSSQLTLRRSIRSPTNELRLPKKCLICSKVKFIHETRTQKKLILCTDLHPDKTLKITSRQKSYKRMIAACSHELVVKEAYYHKICYQSLTRDFLSNQNPK